MDSSGDDSDIFEVDTILNDTKRKVGGVILFNIHLQRAFQQSLLQASVKPSIEISKAFSSFTVRTKRQMGSDLNRINFLIRSFCFAAFLQCTVLLFFE